MNLWNILGGLGLGHHALVLCCCNGSVTALAYDSFKVLNKVSMHEGRTFINFSSAIF
jgi:hypothetical protein